MASTLIKAWEGVLRPFLARPKQVQVAALCFRKTATGKDVLLITSRGTGRWIVPKGWPIDGLNGPQSALQEAWEEAGVKEAQIEETPVGHFAYDKELDNGGIAQVEAQVYLTEVDRLADTYPESDERTRTWVSPEHAANMVREPGLKDILRQL